MSDMPDPIPSEIRVRCVACGEVIVCDESVLDGWLECGDCHSPIVVEHHPKLIELRDKRNARIKAERKEQARLEREKRRREKEAEKAKRLAEAEEQRRELEAVRKKRTAEAEAERKRLAEQVAAAQAEEAAADDERLKGGGGCPRCGSIRLRQKRRTTSAGWGLILGGLACIGMGAVVLVVGFLCGGVVAGPVLIVIGIVMCVTSLPLTESVAVCGRCGWKWRV